MTLLNLLDKLTVAQLAAVETLLLSEKGRRSRGD